MRKGKEPAFPCTRRCRQRKAEVSRPRHYILLTESGEALGDRTTGEHSPGRAQAELGGSPQRHPTQKWTASIRTSVTFSDPP